MSIPSILRLTGDALQYNAADGIWRSPFDTGFVYEPWLAFPPRDELRASLQEGVSPTLDRYVKNEPAKEYVRDNIYEPGRAGWQAVCPIRKDSVVLDFGCGLGALSRSLARNCRTVIGADACYERLMVSNAVNGELGFDNVELLCGDHRVLGEINDGSLDGMVLNGVLEWVPEMADGEPRAAQVGFLRECRRILRPDGWIYIGIENRWGYRYFMDRRDEHSELMYSTLLPRSLANVYSKIVKKKPYRTYTYSPRECRALLAEAGFPASVIYGVLPDYRSFSELRSLDTPGRVSGAGRVLGITKPWKQRVVEAPAFFKRCVPSLGIVGHASTATTRPVWLEDFKSAGHTLDKVYVKHDQASFWYHTPGGQARIRELAMARGATDKLRHIGSLAPTLREAGALGGPFRDWRVDEKAGSVWTDRRMVPGVALSDCSPSIRESHLQRVCETLHRLHALGAALDWPVAGLTQICEENVSRRRDVAAAYWWEAWREVVSTVDRRAAGHGLLMHGDCTASNLLVGDDIVLIDWEWSRRVNFAGYDILKLLWFDDEDPRCATRFWNEHTLDDRFNDTRAERYFRVVHPTSDWRTGVLAYWCVRTAKELGAAVDRGWPPEWIRPKLEASVEAVARTLRS